MTPKSGNPYELFHSYRRGWEDGAVRKFVKDVRYANSKRADLVEQYEAGYRDGTKANMQALKKEMKRVGYKPDLLRSEG